MEYITPYNRSQMEFRSLDDLIEQDNQVRFIEAFAETVEENAQRYKENTDLYRKRQEWNEHIFGTIKRKWGYNHTNLMGLKKVNGEFALIMTVYNMKRCRNILGMDDLIEKIKNWVPNYKGITHAFVKPTFIKAITAHFFRQ